MKIKFYLGFAAALLLTCSILGSCSKSDEEVFRTSDFSPPEVTGYYVRNIFGEHMLTVGTPNVKLGDASNRQNSTYYLESYPNPSKGLFNVSIKDPGNSLKKIWITPANISPNLHHDLTNTMVAGGHPVFQVSGTDKNYFINAPALPAGYYKVYVHVNGRLLHDNILIQHN